MTCPNMCTIKVCSVDACSLSFQCLVDQASSMGSKARAVYDHKSFEFDPKKCRPIPNKDSPYPPTTAGEGGGVYIYNQGRQQGENHPTSANACRHQIVSGCATRPSDSLGNPLREPYRSEDGQGGGASSADDHTLQQQSLDRSRSAPEGDGRRGVSPRSRSPLTLPEQYSQQSLLRSEVHRLLSVEEHEKRLLIELTKCKKERDDYEQQVVLLTEKLSLANFEVIDATNQENKKLREENAKLMDDVASLKSQLSRKDKNISKLKDKVKTQTVGSVLGDEQPGSLQPPAKSMGEDYEQELAKLYQEMKEKDQQNRENMLKLEETGRNLAALMTMRQKSSAAIKSLTEENEQLKVFL